MWGQLEEEYYQRLVEDLKTNGDRDIIFNGIKGKLSLLIEAMQLTKNIVNKSN